MFIFNLVLANLRGANLESANLELVNLLSATLVSANLEFVYITGTTIFSNVNLTGATGLPSKAEFGALVPLANRVGLIWTDGQSF